MLVIVALAHSGDSIAASFVKVYPAALLYLRLDREPLEPLTCSVRQTALAWRIVDTHQVHKDELAQRARQQADCQSASRLGQDGERRERAERAGSAFGLYLDGVL